MSNIPSVKCKKILSALLKKGWIIKNQRGSHKLFYKEGYKLYSLCCHDGDEVASNVLKKIIKHTDLQLEDF
jgi:predicted RNA binding protein YcfA (HicA-like mRNA interferase family)